MIRMLFSALPRRGVLASGLAALVAAPVYATTAEPAKPAEWRILVIGDSQAQGLAAGLMRLYLRNPHVHVLDRSRIGTGLARDSFDWLAEVKKLAESEHANVTVVMFGANDRPVVRLHGKLDPVLAASFSKSYGGKVASIAGTLRAARLPVVWVGHPQVRDPVYNQDMAMLNGIYADQAARAGAQFVPVWRVFVGSDGTYNAYGKGPDGETDRLRADDGVHMTRSGYDVLARLLQPKLDPPKSATQAAAN